MVTIRLEQLLYTVNEDEGPLTVCVEFVDGNLGRPVNFTLWVFQGPGTAVGELGSQSWCMDFDLSYYQLVSNLDILINEIVFICLLFLFYEPQMVLTLLGSQLTCHLTWTIYMNSYVRMLKSLMTHLLRTLRLSMQSLIPVTLVLCLLVRHQEHRELNFLASSSQMMMVCFSNTVGYHRTMPTTCAFQGPGAAPPLFFQKII